MRAVESGSGEPSPAEDVMKSRTRAIDRTTAYGIAGFYLLLAGATIWWLAVAPGLG